MSTACNELPQNAQSDLPVEEDRSNFEDLHHGCYFHRRRGAIGNLHKCSAKAFLVSPHGGATKCRAHFISRGCGTPSSCCANHDVGHCQIEANWEWSSCRPISPQEQTETNKGLLATLISDTDNFRQGAVTPSENSLRVTLPLRSSTTTDQCFRHTYMKYLRLHHYPFVCGQTLKRTEEHSHHRTVGCITKQPKAIAVFFAISTCTRYQSIKRALGLPTLQRISLAQSGTTGAL
ncbi:hypothetical protein IWX92DRAFT_376667 [Phyllosticta citricarpa]